MDIRLKNTVMIALLALHTLSVTRGHPCENERRRAALRAYDREVTPLPVVNQCGPECASHAATGVLSHFARTEKNEIIPLDSTYLLLQEFLSQSVVGLFRGEAFVATPVQFRQRLALVKKYGALPQSAWKASGKIEALLHSGKTLDLAKENARYFFPFQLALAGFQKKSEAVKAKALTGVTRSQIERALFGETPAVEFSDELRGDVEALLAAAATLRKHLLALVENEAGCRVPPTFRFKGKNYDAKSFDAAFLKSETLAADEYDRIADKRDLLDAKFSLGDFSAENGFQTKLDVEGKILASLASDIPVLVSLKWMDAAVRPHGVLEMPTGMINPYVLGPDDPDLHQLQVVAGSFGADGRVAIWKLKDSNGHSVGDRGYHHAVAPFFDNNVYRVIIVRRNSFR